MYMYNTITPWTTANDHSNTDIISYSGQLYVRPEYLSIDYLLNVIPIYWGRQRPPMNTRQNLLWWIVFINGWLAQSLVTENGYRWKYLHNISPLAMAMDRQPRTINRGWQWPSIDSLRHIILLPMDIVKNRQYTGNPVYRYVLSARIDVDIWAMKNHITQ